MSLTSLIATALVLFSASFSHASLYQDRARVVSAQQNNDQLAKINQHYDLIQSRFFMNLARFGQAHSGFAQQPECRDREGSSGGGFRTTRQECSSGLCVSVFGSDGSARNNQSVTSLDVYRRYEMVSSCEVVLRNGYACQVGYIHSQKDAWMVGFGGTCIDANGQARELKVPFKNIKFP